MVRLALADNYTVEVALKLVADAYIPCILCTSRSLRSCSVLKLGVKVFEEVSGAELMPISTKVSHGSPAMFFEISAVTVLVNAISGSCVEKREEALRF